MTDRIVAKTPAGSVVTCPSDYDPGLITDADILHDSEIVLLDLVEGDELTPTDRDRAGLALHYPAAAGRNVEFRGWVAGNLLFTLTGTSEQIFAPVAR